MTHHALQQTGQCRCSRTQFVVDSEPLITMACHCTGCQRMSSSAFSLSALYPNNGFKVTLGEPIIGGLRGATAHYFCSYCMSWLFTRLEGMDDVVNVRATMMDNAQLYSPFAETYTSEKLPWAHTPAKHSFKQFPSQEDFPLLLSEYATNLKKYETNTAFAHNTRRN